MTSGSAQEAGLRLPPLSSLRAQTSKVAADNVFSPVETLQPPPLPSQSREGVRRFPRVETLHF